VKKAVNATAGTETTTNQQNHRMNNNIQIHNTLTRCTLAITLAGLGLLANAVLAQEKGAERLIKLNRPSTAPTSQGEAPKTVPMSCAKCQDMVKQVPDWSAKGGQILKAGGIPTKSVVQHLCEGCSTKLSVVGHGKAKQQVTQHTCTAGGADGKSCCSTVENGKPTQGM
jgi:hypothetical protein